MKLYAPFPYEGSGHKKYSVYVMRNDRPRLIHFGDSRHQQFRDRLGHWAHLDHGDTERRRRWYARHGRSDDPNTALFWASRILW